jgi:hypothetical protein
MSQDESTIPRISITDFAARIKAKHNEYADLDDNDLTRKVLLKYPEYTANVDTSPWGTDVSSALSDVANAAQKVQDTANSYRSANTGIPIPKAPKVQQPARRLVTTPTVPSVPTAATVAPAGQSTIAPASDTDLHGEIGALPAGYQAAQAQGVQSDVTLNTARSVMLQRMAQAKQQAQQREMQRRVQAAAAIKARSDAASKQLAASHMDTPGLEPRLIPGSPAARVFDQPVNLTPQAQMGVGTKLPGRVSAQQSAQIKAQIRAQVANETPTPLRTPWNEGGVDDQSAINEETERRYQAYQLAQTPEMESIRKEYGQMSPAARTLVQPLLREGANILSRAGGAANLGGLLPEGIIPRADQFSKWANARAAIIQTGTQLAPLNAAGQEMERSFGEKGLGALADLGLSVADIWLLKKSTGMPLGRLLALDTALKTGDLPVGERSSKIIENYALGNVLDQKIGRLASAAVFGAPTAVQTGSQYAKGQISGTDALLQTGTQAGIGFAMGGKGIKALPKETAEEVGTQAMAAENLPENIRAAGARMAGREPVIAKRAGSDEFASVFVNPETLQTEAALTKKAQDLARAGDQAGLDEVAARLREIRKTHTVTPLTADEAASRMRGVEGGNRRVVEVPAAEFDQMMQQGDVGARSLPGEQASQAMVQYAKDSPLTSDAQQTEIKKAEEAGNLTDERLTRILKTETPATVPKPPVEVEKPNVSLITSDKPEPKATVSTSQGQTLPEAATKPAEVLPIREAATRPEVTASRPEPKTQNFTQFAAEHGYPSDYDILNHGMLGPSGSMSKRLKANEMARMGERITANTKAKQEYADAIARGEIIDPSGAITKESEAARRKEASLAEPRSRLSQIDSQIKNIEGLGSMSHLPNGKLKAGYQRTVDGYEAQRQQIFKDNPELASRPATEVEGQPAVEGAKLPDYVRESIDQRAGIADKMGVADQIEELAAQRNTAAQTANALKPAFDAAKITPVEAREIIRAVRAKRQIPSLEERPEFEAWVKSRSTPAAEAKPVSPSPEVPPVLYHGTRAEGEIQAGKGSNLHKQGIWLTGAESNAREYADNRPESGEARTVAYKPNFKKTKVVYDTDAKHVDANELIKQGYDSAYMAQSGYWVALKPEALEPVSPTSTVEKPSTKLAPKLEVAEKPEVKVEAPKATTLETNKIHAAKIAELAPRLRELSKSKNLDDLQSILDDALAHRKEHGGNDQINRLITSLRAESYRIRQEGLKEQPEVKPEPVETKPLSKKARKLLRQAESAEGKTVRAKPRHEIGRPKSNPAVNSVAVEARALGGIKSTENFKGEVRRLLGIPGHRGLMNETSGIEPEAMVGKLAESGYRLPGVDFDSAGNWTVTNVGDALRAIEDDASGIQKLHSVEHEHDLENPDDRAYASLVKDDYAQELMKVIESGDARPSDIAAFVKHAESFGFSEKGINDFVDSLQAATRRRVAEAAGEGYSLDDEGTLLDRDGQPLFAREPPQQMGFMDEGLSMQEAPRANQSDLDKQKLKESEAERLAAANPERAKALEKLAELKRRGLSIDEYARQGSMFEASPSDAEIKLLREVEKGAPTAPTGTTDLERQGTEVLLNNKAAVDALNQTYKDLDVIGKKDRISGTYDISPYKLANAIEDAGHADLADAIRDAAEAGNGRVVVTHPDRRAHEVFHSIADKASGYKGVSQQHSKAGFERLQDADGFGTMRDKLIKMGYPKYNIPVLVAEAAAIIEEGRFDQLGVTIDQAANWMDIFMDSFVEHNDIQSPADFRKASYESQRAVERAINRRGNAAKGETINRHLPRLEEGRQRGDQAALARPAEKPQLARSEDPWQRLAELADEIEARSKPLPEWPTGIKNAVTDAEREEKGLPPVEIEARRNIGQVFDTAKSDFDPEISRAKTQQLADHPRALAPEETASAIIYKTYLKNEYAKAAAHLEKAQTDANEEGQVEARLRMAALDEDLLTYHEMARRTGYEQGLGLRLRAEMMKQDYSLAEVKTRARVANKNYPLPEELEKQLEEITRERDAAVEALAAYDEKASQRAAERELKRLQSEAATTEKKEKRTKVIDKLSVEFADLSKQFGRAAAKLSANPLFDPELHGIIGKMVRNRMDAGVQTLDGLVNSIHEAVKEHVVDATERDVRDAISGYGKPQQATQTELTRQLNELKKQARLISKLEDLQAKGVPQNPKKQRQQSEEIRNLQAQINKFVKDHKPAQDPQESALKAYKTRMAKREKDLQTQLDSGNYAKPERRTLTLDRDAIELKGKVGRLSDAIDYNIRKIEKANRSRTEKTRDYLVKARRFVALSSSYVFGKLTSAAYQRVLFTPIEELIGGGLSHLPVLSKVAARAPREGYFNLGAEAKAVATAFSAAHGSRKPLRRPRQASPRSMWCMERRKTCPGNYWISSATCMEH